MNWKDINGHHGYLVSDTGIVKSIQRKVLGRDGVWQKVKGCVKSQHLKAGYPTINLSIKGQGTSHHVHVLVAEAFIGPRPSRCDVMHLDGNPENNDVSNLRYGSRSCNLAFRSDHGTDQNGARNPQAKLTFLQAHRIREFLSVGIKQAELARTFGVSQTAISHINTSGSYIEL